MGGRVRSHDPPLWRWFLLPLAAVVALLVAGWLFIRWVDSSMTGIHVSEDAGGAREFAERHGLVLRDTDEVEYGEIQSSFPDSGAYLVVLVPSTADRDAVIARSRLGCEPADPTVSRRAVADHGSGTSPTLQSCARHDTGIGGLVVTFDPLGSDGGRRLFVDAYDM